ncbi:hypothetical protein [Kocuria sp. CNJ-770]|uniref:hypothetical protein n=1 Tax=Kocuria sp. CNJ-770 TaxID=1904964 RepID=UPI0011151A1B|nr:hypothetical protein [Kocuria sp. CNJ-770]
MKKRVLATVLALGSVVLVGCGSDEPTPAPTAPGVEAATEPPASPSAATGETSERGNLVKELGEPAGFLAAGSDERVLTFAVKDIEVDPACTGEFAGEPEVGHFVAVDIEAETAAQPTFDEAMQGQDYQFNPFSWKFIDANGTTANSVTSDGTYSCFSEAETLPDMIGAAERVTGKLVLDIPTTEGILVYEDPISGTAWEWNIPA